MYKMYEGYRLHDEACGPISTLVASDRAYPAHRTVLFCFFVFLFCLLPSISLRLIAVCCFVFVFFFSWVFPQVIFVYFLRPVLLFLHPLQNYWGLSSIEFCVATCCDAVNYVYVYRMCNAAIYSNETRQVRLPPSTVAMYDKSVEFWMLLRRNLEQAAKICGNSGICKGDRCRNGHVCSPVSEARLPVGPSTSICPTKYLYISDQVPLYLGSSTSICPTKYLYLSD